MKAPIAILFSALLFTGSLSWAGQEAFRPFLKEHCYKCHGPEKQKEDLRLDTLALPDQKNGHHKRWSAVLEMMVTGEMPPEKEPQPDRKTTDEAVNALSAMLRASTPPTLALRRLNRTEYEHTVHDLLGIDVPLADLLPEDGSVQGFDHVADGLSISSVLMERYLEAADTAFESVIRRIKPLPVATRRIRMMEGKENIESVNKKKGGTLEAEGSFVKFTPGWPPARLDPIHPIEDGVYRCRIAAWPYQPSERTMVIAVFVGPLFGPGRRRFKGMYDITGSPKDPTIIEFTTSMKEADALHIVPWVYPEHVTWRDKHEPRPGVGLLWAETEGPLDQSFPSKAQRKLFGESDRITMAEGEPKWMRHRKGIKLNYVDSEKPKEDAERIIRAFVPRAFRRPTPKALVDQFVALAQNRLEAGRTFEQAVRAGVSAVLCSPHFLLLNQGAVDDYTRASRLSYFLWSSMPDEELISLAAKGKLRDPKVRHQQVERMLNDPRNERFVKNFTDQWLDLKDIEFTTPDKKLYPEFDILLQHSMLGETRNFFRHILKNNLSVLRFVHADFTFLNQRLAAHYGIKGVKGHQHFELVKLPKDHIRGGLLTQGSILKVTANGTSTSPVLRGVWVLDNILGRPAMPPPPGVPAVEPDIRGATSIREQLDKHREDKSCARCHARIDPPGFALEEFDPIGGERSWYRSLGEGKRIEGIKSYKMGPRVQSGNTLPGKPPFADFKAFRKQLLEDRTELARAIAQKLLIYGTGRRIETADRPAIDAVVEAAEKNDLGFRSMIHAVVENKLFHAP